VLATILIHELKCLIHVSIHSEHISASHVHVFFATGHVFLHFHNCVSHMYFLYNNVGNIID